MPIKKSFYITTAIPYANADPHIGFALEILYADIMARYQRLAGKEVYFLTGTDEHGQKMYKTAREAGKPVAEYASEKSARFQELADEWNITNDDFIRTTEARHMERAQKFWEASAKSGDIYKKEYEGLYCVGCEAFKTEKDLVDGLCPDHKKKPELVKEENYFFRLSGYQKKLESFFKKNPNFIYPESRFKEMYNILKSGLEDVSISRSKEKLPWGIPVPGDDAQVMYVWFDALTNYVTALGYGAKDDKLFKKFWPADAHVIGKEINRFHSLLWPAMLMSAGLEVPKLVAVHGWLTVNGEKMSKSIGNVIDPLALVKEFPAEAVRYFLAREIPFDNDGDYTREKFLERYNADLANGLGNLTNRVLVMIQKYCDSKIPKAKKENKDLKKAVLNGWKNYTDRMEQFSFVHALEISGGLIAESDQMISVAKPWSMFKEGKKEEVENLLYHLAETLRHIAIMIYPVMPETAGKIYIQLGLDPAKEFKKSFKDLSAWGALKPGIKIGKIEQLFPRL